MIADMLKIVDLRRLLKLKTIQDDVEEEFLNIISLKGQNVMQYKCISCCIKSDLILKFFLLWQVWHMEQRETDEMWRLTDVTDAMWQVNT